MPVEIDLDRNRRFLGGSLDPPGALHRAQS
jgi:hypothetical protein